MRAQRALQSNREPPVWTALSGTGKNASKSERTDLPFAAISRYTAGVEARQRSFAPMLGTRDVLVEPKNRQALTFFEALSRNRLSLSSCPTKREVSHGAGAKEGAKIERKMSRRGFLDAAGKTAVMSRARNFAKLSPFAGFLPGETAADKPAARLVDMHVHFDEKKPGFIDDLLRLAERMNLTACLLTPFAHRRVVADAAKEHPRQVVPFGFVDMDAPDVVRQVEELHSLGFRGLGEL